MTKVFLCFRLVVAVMLVFAVRDLSYEFYSLLRVVTTIAAFEVFWLAWAEHKRHWAIPFAAIAVLWNPLREIELPEETWHALDIAAAVMFLASTYYVAAARLLPRTRKHASSAPTETSIRLPLDGIDRQKKTITRTALTQLQRQISSRIDVSGWTITED